MLVALLLDRVDFLRLTLLLELKLLQVFLVGGFLEIAQSLHHRVDLFVLLAHEHLLEGPFDRQLQRHEQVGLSPLVNFLGLVVLRDLLFILERQLRADSFWHVQRTEHSLVPLPVQLFVVVRILRILLIWRHDALFSPQLPVRSDQPRAAVVHDWIVEPRNLDLIPGLQEHQVRLEDLILEGRPEAALIALRRHGLLESTADA